jgi:hypothetical protein
MHQAGVELSAISQTVLDDIRPFSNLASLIANVSFVALWLGAIYFLFFWRKRDLQ